VQRGIVAVRRLLFHGNMGILALPHVRGYGRPVPLAGRCGRERWSGRASRFDTVRKNQDLWLLIGITGTRARMAFNHPLGRKERLNLFTQNRNAVGLPHPFGALSTKAEALKTETNAGLATALVVRVLVTLLSPYPTSIAARLSAHCTFSFGRPGFLGDFSGGRSGGRRDVATDGGIVRHWGRLAGE
jgi:hypothetical protein